MSNVRNSNPPPINFHERTLDETHHVVQRSGDARHPIWNLLADFTDERKTSNEVTFPDFNFSYLITV